MDRVCKRFGNLAVLRDCSLRVETGETLVIIGQSGGGKSVLLKHIAGLLQPDGGFVLIDGVDRNRMGEEEQASLSLRIGFLFQGAALFDSMSVGENVTFAMRRHTDTPTESLRTLAEEKLNLVGLKGIQDKRPSELSGGMRKRVGLARAIAMNPAIMLYDEPTTGLDPIMADAINELMLDLQRRFKMTSVAVTHDMTSAYKIADRIAMLYEGHIIGIGSVEEIQHSKDEIIQQFIHGRSQGPIRML